jgi:hypothetical protein
MRRQRLAAAHGLHHLTDRRTGAWASRFPIHERLVNSQAISRWKLMDDHGRLNTPNHYPQHQGGQKPNTWAGVAEGRLAIKITWPSL